MPSKCWQMIGRREFIALIGGVTAWPCVLASASEKVRRVGVLANEAWAPLEGLRQGLDELGYVEGRNLQLEYRYAEGQTEKFSALAAELVGLPVEVAPRRPSLPCGPPRPSRSSRNPVIR
jgi:putative ABC transport system substrate-binding protein